MKINEIDRDQSVTVLLIIGILFGLLGLPLIAQHLYSLDAVNIAFIVIIVYALINWYMQNQNQDEDDSN